MSQNLVIGVVILHTDLRGGLLWFRNMITARSLILSRFDLKSDLYPIFQNIMSKVGVKNTHTMWEIMNPRKDLRIRDTQMIVWDHTSQRS